MWFGKIYRTTSNHQSIINNQSQSVLICGLRRLTSCRATSQIFYSLVSNFRVPRQRFSYYYITFVEETIKHNPLWTIQQKKNSPWRIVPTSTTPPPSRNSTSGSAPTPNSRHVSPPQATFPPNAVSHHSRCDYSITTSVSRFSSLRQFTSHPHLLMWKSTFYILHFTFYKIKRFYVYTDICEKYYI